MLAPVTGQRADEGGRRRASLALFTALVIVSTLGLFFVKDSPAYLWLGLVLMAAGSVFMEFAYVSYNAMLHQISTPANIGRISGFGWGSGYLGGIVVLLAAYLLFISPEVGLFGVTDAEGLRYRVLALVVAVWFGVFAIPVLLTVPEVPASPGEPDELPRLVQEADQGRPCALPDRSPRGLVPVGQCDLP